MDDTQILRAVAGGDERAIEALYDAYADRLYGFGMRLLGDAGLAEELVQETFARIWRDGARSDATRDNAKAFIYTVARRVAIDIYRRPSSRPFALEPETPVAGHADDIGNTVGVSRALASISPDHREVLELLHFQRLTRTEAAAVLEVPPDTVKSRAHHAVRAMREAFEEHGIDA